MKVKTAGIGLFVIFVLLAGSTALYAQETVSRISQEKLLSILDDPTLVTLDARLSKEWQNSDNKIRGAVRVDPQDISSWIGKYTKSQSIVVYCSTSGETTSTSVVRQMMKLGFKDVNVLDGGWNSWLMAGYPIVPRDKRL